MHGVAELLAAAAAGHLLARLFRAPVIPFLLLGGLALSTVAAPPAETLESALILGVSFLLFVVGLELDPRRVRTHTRPALQVGLAQFVVLAVMGFAAARALGLEVTEAGFVALALPASSTLVGVRILQRRRQMFEPFGRLTVGVLLLQDLLVLLAIPLVTHLAVGWEAVAVETLGVAALGGAALAVRRWVAPFLVRLSDEHELLLLGALALLFAFLAAAGALGLPLVVGALLAGAALARFPVNGIVRTEMAPIGDFFGAIFFTALGALVRVPTPVELGQALVFGLLVLVVTPPLVTFIAERSGIPSRPAMEAGLLLSQTSEISLVVGLAGMLQGVISESLFVVLALVTLGTMLLTPLLATDAMARRLTHLRPGRPTLRGPPPSDHILLVGAGSTGMPLLEDLLVSGVPVVVVDDDPAVVRRLREGGIRTVRGDATDEAVLREAGADRARIVASTIHEPRDNAALLRCVADVPVLVRVFDEEEAAWVRARGGEAILYSRATADSLMEWFEARDTELEEGWRARSPHQRKV